MMEFSELAEHLEAYRLPNGMRVLVCPQPGFRQKCAYLATDFGSMHRTFTLDGVTHTVPAGTAHYLEHKLFDMPGGRDVEAEFAALGASVNAMTAYDMTAYYFSCTENFAQSLALLLEFVTTPCFTEAGVEKERGIIAQEIGMNADDPGVRSFENLMRAMYRTNPIREPILGTRRSIARITPETLALCHRAFYAPERLLLCVVGDVEPERVAELAARVEAPQGWRAPVRPARRVGRMTAAVPHVRARMDVAAPLFDIGFLCEPAGTGAEAVRREIAGDLAAEALFGESSALYLRLYEQGLIDSSFGGGYETVQGAAMLSCAGDGGEAERVRDALLCEGARLARVGVADAALTRMKRSALGRRIRELDSFDSTCFRLCAYKLSDFDYFRFPEIYRSVTGEELAEFLRRVVRPERCALSVIEPNEEVSS